MRNRYYLMRHGESLANVANRIISLPENGLEGYGLSELGWQQARDSARRSALPSSTLIVASDFLRARNTAQAACEILGAEAAQLHSGLRERTFRDLEGKSGDDYHQVWARDQEEDEHSLFGAESPRALALRLGGVVEELESQHQDRDILLVSHGDPLRFLQLWAAGRPLTQHLEVRLFAPAEIRALHDLPSP